MPGERTSVMTDVLVKAAAAFYLGVHDLVWKLLGD